MKYILVFILFFAFQISASAQPENIKKIMAKLKTGQEATEAEMETMEKWLDSLDDSDESAQKPTGTNKKPTESPASNSLCPKALGVKPKIIPLTRESYVALAKSLMAVYGPKMGISVSEMNARLEAGEKPSDGSDMGAMFMMAGAGSATIYSTAWSAVKIPDDILTANNLGVALKDMGEYVKALQVLLYANSLKPNIPLVLVNLGWVYREMGDAANAKIMFLKALELAPELPSANLGLGLIAECEGNHLQAIKYLKKALASRNSVAGIAAYKQAKAAQSGNESGNQDQPLSDEKGDVGEMEIPELPVSENMSEMISSQSNLENHANHLSERIQSLTQEYMSTLNTVIQQAARANQDPGNSIVFNRDFSKEIFMIQDVTDLLFGENSNYGKALKAGSQKIDNNIQENEKDLPELNRLQEKLLQLLEEQTRLMERLTADFAACGDNSDCQEQAQAKFDNEYALVKYEMEQVEFQACKLQKVQLDRNYISTYQYYKQTSDAFKEAAYDYYAFTNPLLEKIYAPSYNELMNIYRELFITVHLENLAGMAVLFPDLANAYNELKCVDPGPFLPPKNVKKAKLPKKDKAPCPLGEDGISGGIGILSVELSCNHWKISGGEGLLWSIKRDFNKHETTFWGGVGVKGDYGKGNASVEATIGVEISVGPNDVLNDAALTSSVKAGLGGLVEGEVSGRIAVEGGSSIDATGGFTALEIPKF